MSDFIFHSVGEKGILEKFYHWVMEHGVKLDGVKVCAKENFSDVEKYFEGVTVRWGVDTVLEYKNHGEEITFKFDSDGNPVIGECVYSRCNSRYKPVYPDYDNTKPGVGIAGGVQIDRQLQPMQQWERHDNTNVIYTNGIVGR